MNGPGFFCAFALVACVPTCVGLLALRRQVRLWLWLERQWREREAIFAAKRRRAKAPANDQILLFPELKASAPEALPAIAVNDWSCSTPRGKAVGS